MPDDETPTGTATATATAPAAPVSAPDTGLEAPAALAGSTAGETDASATRDAADADGGTGKPSGPGTAAEDGSAPSWYAAKTPEELLDLEDVKPLLEKQRETAREEGRQENRRIQAQLDRQLQHQRSIDQGLKSFRDDWADLVNAKDEDGRSLLSEDGISKLVKRHAETFEVLAGAEQARGMYSGYETFVRNLAAVAKSEALGSDFLERIDDLKQGVTERDATFFDDLLSSLTREATKPLRDKIAELEAAVKNRDTELKVVQRNSTKPPAGTPAGRGGSPITPTDSIEGLFAAAARNLQEMKGR